jgi:filamin
LYPGKGKSSDLRQTSTIHIQAVEKKPAAGKPKVFHGDASKVVMQGTGLKKGFIGKLGNFTLELKDAGSLYQLAVA